LNSNRIFFDITGMVLHFRSSDTYTGIQRTLVSIVVAARKMTESDDLFLSWVDPKLGRYCAIPLKEFTDDDLLDAQNLARLLGMRSHRNRTFPPLNRYSKEPVKYWFHSLRLALSALLGREVAFRRYSTTIAAWREYQKYKWIGVKQKESISFSEVSRAGDKILLIDATWNYSRAIAKTLSYAKANGISINFLIHDLIPLLRPDLVPSHIPIIFHDWLRETIQFADCYIANSEETCKDLIEFLNLHEAKQRPVIVPLAQSKLSMPSEAKTLEPLLRQFAPGSYALVGETIGLDDRIGRLARESYVLCVGTVEIRKNHWRLVQAWDLLRATLPPEKLPKLVVAGKRGWMIEDFEHLMRASGNLGGWVVRLESPSDREIEFLYRHCLFTLVPSLCEGWGLPVGESLSYGRTAAVSNVTSLPEVGGDLVKYFDPLSITSIMETCRDLIMTPGAIAELESRIEGARLRQWSDVARDTLAVLEKEV
jgi:glycosyltransferase involved in cell wall biosynthesis